MATYEAALRGSILSALARPFSTWLMFRAPRGVSVQLFVAGSPEGVPSAKTGRLTGIGSVSNDRLFLSTLEGAVSSRLLKGRASAATKFGE